jgi:hypothetical protein
MPIRTGEMEVKEHTVEGTKGEAPRSFERVMAEEP